MQFTVGRITPLVAVQRMCRNELCSQPSMLSQVSQPTENLTTFLALSLVSSYVASVSACLFYLFHLSVFFLGSYPCQSVGESVDGVIDSFRCNYIASLSFASLFVTASVFVAFLSYIFVCFVQLCLCVPCAGWCVSSTPASPANDRCLLLSRRLLTVNNDTLHINHIIWS